MDRQYNGTEPESAQVIDNRALVHQAVGIISVQLAVPIPAAMKRLQSYAADHQRTIADVAADVVARRLRFDDDSTR